MRSILLVLICARTESFFFALELCRMLRETTFLYMYNSTKKRKENDRVIELSVLFVLLKRNIFD